MNQFMRTGIAITPTGITIRITSDDADNLTPLELIERSVSVAVSSC